MGAEDIAIYYILCSLHVCRHKIEYVFLARLIAKAWRSNLHDRWRQIHSRRREPKRLGYNNLVHVFILMVHIYTFRIREEIISCIYTRKRTRSNCRPFASRFIQPFLTYDVKTWAIWCRVANPPIEIRIQQQPLRYIELVDIIDAKLYRKGTVLCSIHTLSVTFIFSVERSKTDPPFQLYLILCAARGDDGVNCLRFWSLKKRE